MAGFPRRPKPLKARVSLDDLTFVEISNLAEGDLLVFNGTSGLFENSQTLTGAYTFTHTITGTDLTLSNSLAVGNDLTVADDLTVLGDTSLQALIATNATLSGTLSVAGNATFSGTVSISGTLSFASFSVSGSGSIGGNLTVGGTLAVTGAVTLASTLNVTGLTTLSALVLSGNLISAGSATFAGGLSAAGGIVGGTVGSAGDITGGGSLLLSGATYTNNGITFVDDLTAIQIYNGTLLSLSLDSASIIEGTGNPTGALAYTVGSLYLRTDGQANETLWVRGPQAWFPVKDTRDDLDFFYQDWADRQEFILTGSLEAGDINASTANLGGGAYTGNLIAFNNTGGSDVTFTAFNAQGVRQTWFSHPGDGTLNTVLEGPALYYNGEPKYVIKGYGARYMGRSADTSDDVLLEFYNALQTSRYGYLWFKALGGGEQFALTSQVVAANFTVQHTKAGPTTQNVLRATPGAELSLYYDGSVTIATKLGGIDVTGQTQTDTLRVDTGFGTGGQTATFVAANKPGVGTTAPTQWLTVNLNGTDYYIPCFL